MNQSIKKALSSWLILFGQPILIASAALFGFTLFCLQSGSGHRSGSAHRSILADQGGYQIPCESKQRLFLVFADFVFPAIPFNDPLLEPDPNNRVCRAHPSGFWDNYGESGPFVIEQLTNPNLDTTERVSQYHRKSGTGREETTKRQPIPFTDARPRLIRTRSDAFVAQQHDPCNSLPALSDHHGAASGRTDQSLGVA